MISEDGTQRYLYHAVPIQKDGTIKGILYGIYDLSTFSDALLLEFFGGKARLYILEGRQGEFIVSSWNNNKNIYSESLGEQKIKRGHDYNQWIDSLKNGREDHMVAFSEASGEYFYTYAKPVGVNNWMVMISAPESAVFERVVHVHHILIMLAILDLVLLFAYFIWLIAQVHSEVKRNERQIKNMSYMYDVQKTLFNSHQCEESMMEALEKTGRMLTASNVFLCVVGNKKITKIYQWAEDTEKEETTREAHIREVLGAVKNRLATGDSLLIDRRNEKTEIVELRFEAMKRLDISSLMLVPLQNTEGKLIGVLGTMNMKRHWGSAELLEGPAWNFMMALNNIASYRFIQKMGTMDSVTGLKNRNSYEQDLDNYAECAQKQEKNSVVFIWMPMDFMS